MDATFTAGKQADLLLSMRDHDGIRRLMYILVEHKSCQDSSVAVQLHRYPGEIRQQQWVNVESEVPGSLPVIHPVVFYHGAKHWTAPLRLSGLHRDRTDTIIPGTIPLEYSADLTYRLVDLRELEPEHLQIRTRTLAGVSTVQHPG